MSSIEPSNDELLQEEPPAAPLTPIPVVVQGPVRNTPLGSRTVSMVNLSVDPAETICGKDFRRSAVKLYATTGTAAFFVGTDRRAVEDGTSARFNSGVLVTLNTIDQLYARSAAPGTACQLSIILEQWAD